MIGLDRAVFGIHRAAFDNRQNVTLDTLARNFGALSAFAAGNLVNFINENDDFSQLLA